MPEIDGCGMSLPDLSQLVHSSPVATLPKPLSPIRKPRRGLTPRAARGADDDPAYELVPMTADDIADVSDFFQDESDAVKMTLEAMPSYYNDHSEAVGVHGVVSYTKLKYLLVVMMSRAQQSFYKPEVKLAASEFVSNFNDCQEPQWLRWLHFVVERIVEEREEMAALFLNMKRMGGRDGVMEPFESEDESE